MKPVYTTTQGYREQAESCRTMAASAPTDELRHRWFALAECYERTADALLPGQPSRLFAARHDSRTSGPYAPK